MFVEVSSLQAGGDRVCCVCHKLSVLRRWKFKRQMAHFAGISGCCWKARLHTSITDVIPPPLCAIRVATHSPSERGALSRVLAWPNSAAYTPAHADCRKLQPPSPTTHSLSPLPPPSAPSQPVIQPRRRPPTPTSSSLPFHLAPFLGPIPPRHPSPDSPAPPTFFGNP